MAQSGSLRSKILLIIISFLGSGLISRKMPGTIGSLAATLINLTLLTISFYFTRHIKNSTIPNSFGFFTA